MTTLPEPQAPEPAGPAAQPQVKRVFFPCFDGFRALAAGAVLLLHVGVASGFAFRHASLGRYVFRLDVGVAVFFLISGFLLYRPFAAAHLADGEADQHSGHHLRPTAGPTSRPTAGPTSRPTAGAAHARLLPRPFPPHLPRVLGRADGRRAVPARADAPDPRPRRLPLLLPVVAAVHREASLRRYPAGVDAVRRGQLLRLPAAVGARDPAHRGARREPAGGRARRARRAVRRRPRVARRVRALRPVAQQPRPARAPGVLRRVRARDGPRGRERVVRAAGPDVAAVRARGPVPVGVLGGRRGLLLGRVDPARHPRQLQPAVGRAVALMDGLLRA